MTKQEYFNKWKQEIQEKVWQREVFIAIKEKEGRQEEIDTFKFNNEKDQQIIDWLNENNN